jgi:hypothetical protein
MLVYWVAQILGSIFGALWIAILVPGLDIGSDGSLQPLSGCFYPASNLSRWDVFGWEATGTFCFILPIFSVVWYTIHKEGYGNTGPLMVGLSLIANALAVGQFTGAAFNPARVIGSPAVFKCDNTFMPFYIFGEMVGASIVPLIIAPWYGISPNAWYMEIVSPKTRHFLDKVQVEMPFNTEQVILSAFYDKLSANPEIETDELKNTFQLLDISPRLTGQKSFTQKQRPTYLKKSPSFRKSIDSSTFEINAKQESNGMGTPNLSSSSEV